MTDFLVKCFVKDHDKTEEPQVRTSYGILASICLLYTSNLMIKFRDTYLENRILNRNELIIQLNIKTSEAMWSSD